MEVGGPTPCWPPRSAVTSAPRSTTLPERQALVITLRDVLGHTSGEVCELLEISGANQRVLLHRARAAVREHLADYLGRESATRSPEVL